MKFFCDISQSFLWDLFGVSPSYDFSWNFLQDFYPSWSKYFLIKLFLQHLPKLRRNLFLEVRMNFIQSFSWRSLPDIIPRFSLYTFPKFLQNFLLVYLIEISQGVPPEESRKIPLGDSSLFTNLNRYVPKFLKVLSWNFSQDMFWENLRTSLRGMSDFLLGFL